MGQTILTRSFSSCGAGVREESLLFYGKCQGDAVFDAGAPGSAQPGRIYHWRVLAGQGESDQLVLAVEQTKNVNWFRDPEGVEVRQILLGQLTSLRFAYGQGDQEVDTWDAETAKALPDWVRIYLTPKGREPLVLVYPHLRVGVSPCAPDSVTAGPGTPGRKARCSSW